MPLVNKASEALLEACTSGDIARVGSALKCMSIDEVNALDSEGNTALHVAIKRQHDAVVKQLLAAGSRVDVANGKGRLPLHAASAIGNVRIVKLLLAAGAKPDETGPDGSTPWRLACVEGHTQTVDIIMSSTRSSSRLDVGGSEVLLHVYFVGHRSIKCDFISALRAIGGCLGGPCRTSCGVYHTAIEIVPLTSGFEWSYGYTTEGTGVYSESARENPRHDYYDSVSLGKCKLLEMELDEALQQLSEQWLGSEYHFVRHNCQSFCAKLIETLGTRPLPDWVTRANRAGTTWLRWTAFWMAIPRTAGRVLCCTCRYGRRTGSQSSRQVASRPLA